MVRSITAPIGCGLRIERILSPLGPTDVLGERAHQQQRAELVERAARGPARRRRSPARWPGDNQARRPVPHVERALIVVCGWHESVNVIQNAFQRKLGV